MKRNDGDITSVETTVTACCVLHNLSEMNRDACEEAWICTQMESSNNSQSRMNSAGEQSFGDKDSGSTVTILRTIDTVFVLIKISL